MQRLWIVLLGIASLAARAGTVIETEKAKPIKRSNTLATCQYQPSAGEKDYFSKLTGKERTTGSFMEPYSIHGKQGANVSWYGIVRQTSSDKLNHFDVLLEHKFFDGLTDCHIMLVSRGGGGDFHAMIETDGQASIPALALVRVYGKVVKEENGVPTLVADYVRVWPWFAFTLTDLGPKDEGNPKWRELCRPCKAGRVYNPFPNEQYYLDVLGDPKDFSGVTAAGPPAH
jgi:hypothetical protein